MDWLILLLAFATFAVTQAVFVWAAITLRSCTSREGVLAFWCVMFTGAVQWVIYLGHIGVFVAGRITGVEVWKHVLTALS